MLSKKAVWNNLLIIKNILSIDTVNVIINNMPIIIFTLFFCYYELMNAIRSFKTVYVITVLKLPMAFISSSSSFGPKFLTIFFHCANMFSMGLKKDYMVARTSIHDQHL